MNQTLIQNPVHLKLESFKLDKQKINKLKEVEINFHHFIETLGALKNSKVPDFITRWYYLPELANMDSDKIKFMCRMRVQKMIKNRRLKKNWSSEDIMILAWIVGKYAQYHSIKKMDQFGIQDWEKLSAFIPGTTGEGCQFRWLNLHKNKLSANQWKEQQSLLLAKVIGDRTITNWKELAQQFYQKNLDKNKVFRTAKQCREHWACYLSPGLKKGPWKQDQDLLLISQIYKNNGKKRWSIMAKKFKGRTENALKNRYNLLMEKQLLKINQGIQKDQLAICKDYLERKQQFGGEIKEEDSDSEIDEEKMSEPISVSIEEIEVKQEQDPLSNDDNKLGLAIPNGYSQTNNEYCPCFQIWLEQNASEK